MRKFTGLLPEDAIAVFYTAGKKRITFVQLVPNLLLQHLKLLANFTQLVV